MKIIVCKPGRLPEQRVVREEMTLRYMQQIVEGHIEVVHADGLPKGVVIVCNEEGKLQNLPQNMWITRGGAEDLLVGTFFVCKTEGEELVPLTDAEAAKIAAKLSGGVMPAFDAEEPEATAPPHPSALRAATFPASGEGKGRAEAETRVQSVVDRLGQIADRVCGELCKYKAQVDADDAAMDEICGKCPLLELV